jgi:hypothetical protein
MKTQTTLELSDVQTIAAAAQAEHSAAEWHARRERQRGGHSHSVIYVDSSAA